MVNFLKIEIISRIFSDHSAVRLDINYRKKKKKLIKNTNTWKLNNTLLNNQEVTEEIKEEIKKYPEANDNENLTTRASLMAQMVKNAPAMQETQVQFPGEGLLENGMATL